MLISGDYPFNFNYATFDQQAGLYVAALIYDVTTGTPVLTGAPIAMVDQGNGVYTGTLTPQWSKAYLVIIAVYLDAGFTMPDTSRSPAAQNYESYAVNNRVLNFNYAAFDQSAGLTLTATVYNLTDLTQTTVNMGYVTLGVYYGQSVGVVGKSYLITKVCSDPDRSPGSDSIQTFQFVTPYFYELPAATLTGQSLDSTEDGVIIFTQGDSAILTLYATDGKGNPVDITNATITTFIKGPNGVIASFPNSQHQIITGPAGVYQLTLSTTDTGNCGLGPNKTILSQIVSNVIGTVYFRGINILTVYPPVPLQ